MQKGGFEPPNQLIEHDLKSCAFDQARQLLPQLIKLFTFLYIKYFTQLRKYVMELIGDIAILNNLSELSKVKKIKYRVLALSNQERDVWRTPSYTILDTKQDLQLSKRSWFNRIKKFEFIKICDLATVLIENNYLFYINIQKGYFNTRYSNFRNYLSNEIKNEGIVTVLFNGYGPYSVYLSKKNHFVIGYDGNPACAYYAKCNYKINNSRNCTVYTEDILDTLKYIHFTNIMVSILPTAVLITLHKICKLNYDTHFCMIAVTDYSYNFVQNLIGKLNLFIDGIKFVKAYNAYTKIYCFKLKKCFGSLI